MPHPPPHRPRFGAMTLNGRDTPNPRPPSPSRAPEHVRLARTPPVDAQAAWEAHLDAGRIGRQARHLPDTAERVAAMEAALGLTRRVGIW